MTGSRLQWLSFSLLAALVLYTTFGGGL